MEANLTPMEANLTPEEELFFFLLTGGIPFLDWNNKEKKWEMLTPKQLEKRMWNDFNRLII